MTDDHGHRFGSAGLPTPHRFRSALRAARLLAPTGTPLPDARISYRRSPSGGLYRLDDLVAGEELLLQMGLLRLHQGVLYAAEGLADAAASSDADGCEALLIELLERRPPLWLFAARSSDGLVEELIPDDQRRILDDLIDPAVREELLLQIGRRFSDEEQAATGALAEEFVVKECRRELTAAGEGILADRVRRVSLRSDQLGYDVTAPRRDGSTRRLEVKGTRHAGANFALYLSRNEAKRGLVDPDWSLVCCRVLEDDDVELVGHLPGASFEPYLPVDPSLSAQWQSVQIEFLPSSLVLGLPAI